MLGGEKKDALTITESISRHCASRCASATESQSSLLQFGQALASGRAARRGIQLRRREQPRLARPWPMALNVPIGRLRKLAEEGRLTADVVVVNALMSQKDKLASRYAQLPRRSASLRAPEERLRQWINKLDESTGFTKSWPGVDVSAKNLDTVMQWLGRIAEVRAGGADLPPDPGADHRVANRRCGGGVTAASATAAAWATANLSVSNAIASVGVLKTAFAVLGVASWSAGRSARGCREVRDRPQGGHLHGRGADERHRAIAVPLGGIQCDFTSDTIEQATKRHQARLAEMNQIFARCTPTPPKGRTPPRAR